MIKAILSYSLVLVISLSVFPKQSFAKEIVLRCGWGKDKVSVENHTFRIDTIERSIKTGSLAEKLIMEEFNDSKIVFMGARIKSGKKVRSVFTGTSEYCKNKNNAVIDFDAFLEKCHTDKVLDLDWITKYTIDRYSGGFKRYDHLYTKKHGVGVALDGRVEGSCKKVDKLF